MKKYIWGLYKGTKYSLLEVNLTENQVVLRLIGTKTHLTLHGLEVLRKIPGYYFVKYQSGIRKLSKRKHIPISWDLSDPILKNIWSDETVTIARKMGFANPEKHAYSVQNLLDVRAEKSGCYICGIRIKINNSSKKHSYLDIEKKMGEIIMPSNNFMMEFIFMTRNNKQFPEKYDFVIDTLLGKICLTIENSI